MLQLIKKKASMEQTNTTKPKAFDFNQPAYALFLLAGIYFLTQKDFSQAVIFWGLGLVFDPFKKEIPFSKRPAYQQLWLLVHLSITLALFVLMLMGK
jgi:hypothetical protein